MTPEQQVAELLKPRRKVIAPFPAMETFNMKVGDIITDPDNPGECCRHQNGDAAFTFDWELYPHLFQPLPWYAERKADEMPDYVKTETEVVVKVTNHFIDIDRLHCEYGEVSGDCWLAYKFVLPATETEYLEYINREK